MTAKENESAGLDLSSIQESTAELEWMEVVHPVSGKGTGAWIKLYSAESEVFRDAQNKALNRRARQRRGSQGFLTAEEQEQEQINLFIKVTADWKNIQMNGETLSCTEKNARQVYENFPWLREQVDTFISDRANFIKS